MDRSDFCGCKGVRTCIKCEAEYGYENKNIVEFTEHTYVYCPYCNKAWPGTDINDYKSHPNHAGNAFDIGGVYIKEDFLSQSEAEDVLNKMDAMPWDKSQSGRRKQNFGPKCNFKRQKIKLGDFQGFPACTKFIQDRFEPDPVLKDFQTIEQCSLEYVSENGSSIDNHIDDCWIWGERIVTVNVIGDSVLTLTYYNGESNKYNLDCGCYSYVKKYSNSSDENSIPKNPNTQATSVDPMSHSADGHSPSSMPSDQVASVEKDSSADNSKEALFNNGANSSTISGKSHSALDHSPSSIPSDQVGSVEKDSCAENSKEPFLNNGTNSSISSKPHSDNGHPASSIPSLSNIVVRIPMPARSLLVLYGEARYEWLHCVLREDVEGRRVCIAYREFTTPYLNNALTRDVFEKAKCFF